MGELHTGSKHPLSGIDPEFYFTLHVVPLGYQPKGDGDRGYLAKHNQTYFGRVGLISLGRLPTYGRGTPMINPRAGEDLVGNSPRKGNL